MLENYFISNAMCVKSKCLLYLWKEGNQDELSKWMITADYRLSCRDPSVAALDLHTCICQKAKLCANKQFIPAALQSCRIGTKCSPQVREEKLCVQAVRLSDLVFWIEMLSSKAWVDKHVTKCVEIFIWLRFTKWSLLLFFFLSFFSIILFPKCD